MRRSLAIVGAVALAAALSIPVQAGGQLPLAFAPDGNLAGGNIQQPVEQESPDWQYPDNAYNMWRCTHDEDGTEHPDTCVHNPTFCPWDSDDSVSTSGWGTLAGRTSVSGSLCVIADGYDNSGGDDKHVDVRLAAPVGWLAVNLTDSLGNAWTAVPIPAGNGWDYNLCTVEHTAGAFEVIPDSNGGTGLRIDYTLTVANPTNHTARSVAAHLQAYGIGYLAHWAVCP